MSLAKWVELYVCGGRHSKLGQLIENALSEELRGRLNVAQRPRAGAAVLGRYQATSLRIQSEFKLYYGVSNERLHIRGGNDQIPCLLGKKLGDAVQTGTALIAVTSMEGWKGAAVADPRFQGFRRGL